MPAAVPLIGAGIGAAGSIIGANKAADAAGKGDAAAIAEQRRQFDTILGLTAPQRDVGNQALNTLASAFVPGYSGMDTGNQNDAYEAAYAKWAVDNPQPGGKHGGGIGKALFIGAGGLLGGLAAKKYLGKPNGSEAASRAQFDALVKSGAITVPKGPHLAPIGAAQLSEQFRNLPGTQFMLNEQNRNIGNSFAARGGALSGNALRALADRTSAFASDRIFGQLNTLAGFGNSATNTASGAASATGANVSNLLAQQGSDRASGILAGVGGATQAIQGGINNYLLWKQQQKAGG
jgi:hypothetical protein